MNSKAHRWGFPGGSYGKDGLQCRRPGCNPWVRKIPWRREWQPTPVFLPGEFHGERSLAAMGYCHWGCKESDTTERPTLSGFPGGAVVKNLPTSAGDAGDSGLISGWGRFHGEGNGKPLQYSCLENAMDRGAWWTIVHGVTKSQSRLSTHM